ncbi:MAG: hypothetical protein L6R40_004670 [Gallowayella cf. fulva]|nr:MAG: hypothetical protein L6R40_004670 [Xanthomendoza cf. fulva]
MTSIISAISRDQAAQSRTSHKIRSALAETEASYRATDLERHLYRRFRPGDIYAPHDLSPAEQQKWRSRTSFGGNISKAHARTHKQNARDVFDVLGVHPLDEFKNFSIMAEFVTSMGRIRHRRDTGLRGVNQRRMAKAVRRAVGMGLMPSVHKHPEMLEKEAGELARKRDDKKIGNGGMNRGRGHTPNGHVDEIDSIRLAPFMTTSEKTMGYHITKGSAAYHQNALFVHPLTFSQYTAP